MRVTEKTKIGAVRGQEGTRSNACVHFSRVKVTQSDQMIKMQSDEERCRAVLIDEYELECK